MDKYAILVAGGKGLRMGLELPKQFIEVGDRPILMHSIQAFYLADPTIKIILVLPREQMEYWRALCELHHFKVPLQIVEGGSTRFQSVKNGLKLVAPGALVAIHDGVRPFVTARMIHDAYACASQYGGAIPVIEVIDSVRMIGPAGDTVPVDRDSLKLVQTPQTFCSELIIKAYNVPYDKRFTDDASVYEAMGETVHCFAGDRKNIKITTPYDLLIAEALIE